MLTKIAAKSIMSTITNKHFNMVNPLVIVKRQKKNSLLIMLQTTFEITDSTWSMGLEIITKFTVFPNKVLPPVAVTIPRVSPVLTIDPTQYH